MINSQIRKYKKTDCHVCQLGFYPLWDQEGNWILDPNMDLMIESFVNPLDLEEEFSQVDWLQEIQNMGNLDGDDDTGLP